MTSTNHTITPPLPLLVKWKRQYLELDKSLDELLLEAARWGAEQELEACCEWVSQFNYDDYSYQERLRAARRRPKPPSLKEQALQALANADGADHPVVATVLTTDQHALIRKALAEPEPEGPQPVPVSERLPGPRDCDVEGMCWWFAPETDSQSNRWVFSRGTGTEKYWLPHSALHLPSSPINFYV